MIERIVIKEALTFNHAELRPDQGLNIFSGPSGAGKSVLMGAILALFGLKDAEASLSEAALEPIKNLEDFPVAIEDELIIRQLKKEKVRFFVNDSQIGRPALKRLFEGHVRHLSQRENEDLASENLLILLDRIARQKDEAHQTHLAAYRECYDAHRASNEKLESLREQESRAQELKEFAQFEIEKIESLDPKPEEYDHLMALKKRLSKKEKIGQLIESIAPLREEAASVHELYELLGVDGTLFSEAMGELEGAVENALSDIEEMEGTDPGQLLERIEALSGLIRRYGSIEEALGYAETKRAEVAGFESIGADIKQLEKEVAELNEQLQTLQEALFQARQQATIPLAEAISATLEALFLPQARLDIQPAPTRDRSGGHRVRLHLNGVDLDRISAGEFNRLRLALLHARMGFENAKGRSILFLDEIDANVSGEEAAAIARVLKKLAERYQIFAISHQSQLTSKADCHYLVAKDSGQSQVRALNRQERIAEIGRIISGEAVTDAALEHAKKLLEE
jgi:DNA repair protein RecN (Recombination protein N)